MGLDVGQKRDPSALVVVERSEVATGEVSRVTFERVREVRQVVRWAEAMPLGLEYGEIVERVRAVAGWPELEGRCTVAVDATGVGAPVVEMLKRAGLGCTVTGVVITGGERAKQEGGEWRVPKRVLVQRLLVMLEQGELRVAGRMAGADKLMAELAGMRVRGERMEGVGVHDDLVMALALACWVGKGGERRDIFGTKNIGIYW